MLAITNITLVFDPKWANAKTRHILDRMDDERENRVTDWMSSTTRNPRGTMPQYDGFRGDWYDFEEEYLDNMDRS